MFYDVNMDAPEKLQLFAGEMGLEPAEEVVGSRGEREQGTAGLPACHTARRPSLAGSEAKKQALGIYQAVTPGGKTIPLLKTMLTSACERDCYYCPFRAGRNYRRATFKPEEMARTVDQMHRAGLIEGLFLSSGIAGGGARTQDRLLESVEILRRKYAFRGYIHLKVMPGAEEAQVAQAMLLADRLSVNLEAPTSQRLQQLAPGKQLVEELVRPLQWIEAIRRTQPAHLGWKGRWPSTVTQFVVGAAGDTDLELLNAASYLYRQTGLSRTYFSAFRPISDTPLEHLRATPPMREHRLYQTSFLLRDYGFNLEELPFDEIGNLPLGIDPKVAWARAHLAEAPVEINGAGREALLRVPGIGPKGADAILRARRHGKLRGMADLQKIGVVTTRLAPFVLMDGRRPAYQMGFEFGRDS